MTTYEWLSLIVVLLGGFWVLEQKLTKIEVAIQGKVSFKECSEKRYKCPCVRDIEKIKEQMEEKKWTSDRQSNC